MCLSVREIRSISVKQKKYYGLSEQAVNDNNVVNIYSCFGVRLPQVGLLTLRKHTLIIYHLKDNNVIIVSLYICTQSDLN